MKLHAFLLATAAVAAAPVASASTVDMTFVATLQVPSCTIALSNGGSVDLGQINLTSLLDAPNPMPAQSVDVAITCASAARVATSVTEDRPGTSMTAGDAYFGLGRTSSSNPIGTYQVFGENGLADSVATDVIGSIDAASWVSPAGGVPLEHGAGYKLMSVGTTASGPAAATTQQFTLRIEPTINASSQLGVTGLETIDGQMTLSLVYL